MLLSCSDLCVSYDGRRVVKNATFTINDGDYVCVVGENGSGKTTLLRALLGLTETDSGTITFDEKAKKEIGYLPQKLAVSSDFPASVNEIVLSGCVCRKTLPFYNVDDRCKADDAMKLLSIDNLRRASFNELSGGQQQRVLLARAFCAATKLILLDEPITSLDMKTSTDFYAVLEHLNKEHSIAVLMVSHDAAAAVKYADKIIHMDTDMVFFGETSEYIQTQYYKSLIGDRQ